jgi:hypothetical protein
MRRAAGGALRARVLLAAALVVALSSATARADNQACAAANRSWAARCASATGLRFLGFDCPPGKIVVRVVSGAGPPLKVEIASRGPNAFRNAGAYGLSPVGEFSDWKVVAPGMRRGFDKLAQCVGRAGTLPSGSAPPVSTGTSRSRPWRLPWMLVGALALLAAVSVPKVHRAAARRRWLVLPALGGVALGCFALRRALLPFAYLHQNGQGPLWVQYAFRGVHGLSNYGPGYADLFSAAAHALSSPARGVFLLQSALGACAVPAAWIIARRVGAKPPLAASLAALVLLDPMLARAAQSESYFAACTSLLFLATAALAQGSWHGRSRSLRFNAAVASAGLFIALAACVHPVCWVPAAMVPAVVLVERGSLLRRVQLAAHAALGIALVVAIFAGPAMLRVVKGELGREWMPHADAHVVLASLRRIAVVIVIGLVVIVVLRRQPRWRRVALGAATVTIACLVSRATNLLAHPNPWVDAAYFRLFAPVALVGVAAMLSSAVLTSRWQRRVALGVAALGVAAAVGQRRLALEQPTDVREEAWASQWQARLPAGAWVVYLQRAGKRIQVLPLYRRGAGAVRVLPVTDHDVASDFAQLGRNVYYYHSSICSSPEGRGLCDRIERSVALWRVASRDLPAVPSMRGLPYDSDRVPLVLYRVHGARSSPPR